MILLVNACIRGEDSRTLLLARHLLDKLAAKDPVPETADLVADPPVPLDSQTLALRQSLIEAGDYSHPMMRYARQFAQADTVVVAAPYWDLSFPAALKAYIEHLCVLGLTFTYNEEDRPVSLCRAKKLYYVTTAGGVIGEHNFGYDYVRSVMREFFGIRDCEIIMADRLDLVGEDPKELLDKALSRIDTLTCYFLDSGGN